MKKIILGMNLLIVSSYAFADFIVRNESEKPLTVEIWYKDLSGSIVSGKENSIGSNSSKIIQDEKGKKWVWEIRKILF